MAATESTMVPLGTTATPFILPDTISDKMKSLADLQGTQGTVILFMCNHCPFVQHIKPQLIDIAHHYLSLGIGFVAINANDSENYPQDAPDKMKAMMRQWGNPFSAYLYDESQDVAKVYQATCTPDLFLFDAQLQLVYRGRLDGSTPQNGVPLSGEDLRNALDNLLSNNPISSDQKPSIGCNIKWKL